MNPSEIELCMTPKLRFYLPGEEIATEVFSPKGNSLGTFNFIVESYAGSGFAGQVYKAKLVQTSRLHSGIAGQFAIKILRPTNRWKEWFRDALFFLSYQTVFAPRVRDTAVRAGLLTNLIIHHAATCADGEFSMFANPVGYFWDSYLTSYAEIYSWETGRTQKYTPDKGKIIRWLTRRKDPSQNEMERKRFFMDWLVSLCNKVGAEGVARQYEWDTWIAQANVLTRASYSNEVSEFVAVDWRPGLAVPFFLPLSPAHAKLIWHAVRHGRLVLFDYLNVPKLREYCSLNQANNDEFQQLVDNLVDDYDAYHTTVPDLWQSGGQVILDPEKWTKLRFGLVDDWLRLQRITPDYAGRIQNHSPEFLMHFVFSGIPFIGSKIQKIIANSSYQQHLRSLLKSSMYRRIYFQSVRSHDLIEWQWENRITMQTSPIISRSIGLYLLQKIILSWMPVFIHRLLADSSYAVSLLNIWFWQPLQLLINKQVRQQWIKKILQSQTWRGIINADEAAILLCQLEEGYMQSFLRDLGFVAGLEIFSRLLYIILGVYGVYQGSYLLFLLAILGPISPSGLIRTAFIGIQLFFELPVIIKKRNLKLLAARLGGLITAPWRFIGNFCVLVEMYAYNPQASLLIADYFVSKLVKNVPVFGGKGKLLEYKAFQLVFNLPLSITYTLQIGIAKIFRQP